jgi:O-antigen/teichoic acid export membrane protein
MNPISIKKNIIFNYSSQIFIIVISVATLPKLITVMGTEAYGLISFFSLIQSWIMLLDLGMSPTLTREIARFNGGALKANDLLHLFNSMKKIFIGLAIVVVIFILLSSDFIVTSWLKTELDYLTLMNSVGLMALILAFRWVASVYRAVVIGFEKLVWLGVINVVFAVLRFLFIFIVLIYIDTSPVMFFVYQLIVSIVELIVLVYYVRNILPSAIVSDDNSVRPLKEILGFSLTIAFTGAVWIIITQTDKLILSKLLPLSEYGYYSLSVQVAGAITLISGPISSVILPRLSKMEAEGKQEELIALYRSFTRLIVIITGTASLILVFFSKQVIFAWTGNLLMVEKVSKYTSLYAIGNFFLAIAAFPYYLQYAKGNLKFHLIGNIFFVLFLIPSLVVVVNKFGGIGAGYVWIGMNSLYLFIWVPIINNYFVKGLNIKWYFNDIFRISVPAIFITYLLTFLFSQTNNRIYSFLELIFVGFIILITCLISSGEFKSLRSKIKY